MRKTTDTLRTQHEQNQKVTQGMASFLQDFMSPEEKAAASIMEQVPGGRENTPPPPNPARTRHNPDRLIDIVTFCEHDYYLGLKLTPWQKIILKAFYSGSHGNQHLEIDDTKSENCNGCVWEHNRSAEITHCEALEARGDNYEFDDENVAPIQVKPPYMLAENSPCLECERFSCDLRKIRYNNLRQEALNKKQLMTIDDLENREIFDQFTTEQDLVSDKQLDDRVREQMTEKWGNQFQELVLVLGRRSGKAVALDTPIYTPTGWKTMGDMKVGDQVFGDDGLPTNVIATSEIITDEDTYEIAFSNGEKITAGSNHDWKTYTKAERKNMSRGAYVKEPKPQIFNTKEIFDTLYAGKSRLLKNKGQDTYRTKVTHESNHAIKTTMPLQFEQSSKLPIHPYVLGEWLGDGCQTHGIITTADAECIEHIEKCGYRITKVESSKYGWRIRENSKGVPFITTLKSERLTHNKHIPSDYLHASVHDRLELLRGLLDSDGYCDPTKHTVEFCNTNKRLSEQVYELVCGLGFKASIKESDAKLYGRVVSKKYRIAFTPTTGVEVFKLSRKLQHQSKSNKSDIDFVFIRDVKKLDQPLPLKCIQVDNESHMYLCGKSMIPTHNSFLVSVIALYEVYKFLMMGHPQARFPIMEHDSITICNVAVSEKQAKEAIFDKIRNLVFTSPFFTPYVGKENSLELHFLTPYDIEANKRRMLVGQTLLIGSIQLMSGHSNSAALVGRTMAVIIIDEMAEMAKNSVDAGTDDDLYTKLKPSITTFGMLGKIICISNPLGPIGKFYSLYKSSFDDPTTLMMQLPTWLSNPNVQKSYLSSEKLKDPTSYSMHYGAQFGSSGSEPFLPPESVDYAFDRGEKMRRREVGLPMTRYFAHLDPAYSSDNYTLAVVHAEPIMNEIGPDGKNLQRIIVDHIMIWEPKGKNHPVNVEEVDAYVLNLASKFKFVQVSYDHWNSQGSIQKLKMHGLNAKETPFTRQYQDLIFQEFIDLFLSNRIDMYGMNTDDPYTGRKLEEVTKSKDQLKQLQKHYKGGRPKIEALPGGHDDVPDCLASASYQALKDEVYEQLPKIRAVYLSPRFR